MSEENEESENFTSDTVKLHYYANQISVPTAYVIVTAEKGFIDTFLYIKELLLDGTYTLIDVYQELKIKNDRITFDMVVTYFIECVEIMRYIDNHQESPIKEVLDHIEEQHGIRVTNFLIYRIIKNQIDDDNLDVYEEDSIVEMARIVNNSITYEDISRFYNIFDSFYGKIKKDENGDYNKASIVRVIADFEMTYARRKTRGSSYNNYEDIKSSINRHHSITSQYLREDEKRLEFIDRMRSELESIEEDEDDPVIISPNVIEQNAVISLRPMFKSNDDIIISPTEIDGLDIFNDVVATKYIPYIQYTNHKEEKYFKILSGDFDYSIISLDTLSNQPAEKDTIHAILWLDDVGVSSLNDDDDIYDWTEFVDSPGNSFYSIVYNLREGFMDVSIPNSAKDIHINDQKDILNRLSLSFPSLNVERIDDVKVKGYFDVYGVQIQEHTFLHALIHDERFYSYLYAEEKIRPFPFKQRMDIHYNGLYSYMGEEVKIVSEERTERPFEYKSIPFSVQLRQLTDAEAKKEGVVTPYAARFSVNGSARIEAIEQGMEVIRVLLVEYKKLAPGYEEVYAPFLSKEDIRDMDSRHYSRLVFENEEGGVQMGKSKQKVRELKEKAPSLFVDGYAGICQNTGQPVIIDDEDVEKWKQETFDYHGERKNRQIMPFPPDKPQWNFGCPNRIKPFPGIIPNMTLSNRDEFKEIPCCFRHDHISKGSSSLYNERYHQQKKKVAALNPRQPISTNKIIRAGQTGLVPMTLDIILSPYREQLSLQGGNENWRILRMGVPISPNSFIHSLLIAVMDEEYANARTDNEREDLAIRNRIEMAKLDLEVVKQENYDRTLQEISDELNDPNLYLDQERYIRLLEEYFSVNIFLFTLVGTDDITTLVPRHRSFYVKVPRDDRPTVLLLKHTGSATDIIENPHTELLIDFNSINGLAVTLFDLTVTKLCQRLFESTVRNVSWFQNETRLIRKNEAALPIYTHFNFYNLINIPDVLGVGITKGGISNLVGQYLDGFGKARAFIVEYKNKVQVAFFVPPTAPEIAPGITLGEVPFVSIQHLPSLVEDRPSSIVREGDKIVGVWYKFLDLNEGFYVPTEGEPESNFIEGIPNGPPNPLFIKVTKISSVDRYLKLSRILEWLMEIIEWLYELYRRDLKGDNPDPEDFFNLVFTVKELGKVDSETYFDTSRLVRILPDVQTLDEALIYLEGIFSPMEDGKIVLYSSVLADRLLDKIREYDNRTLGRSSHVKKTFNTFYRVASDFSSRENNFVIIGYTNLEKWMNSRRTEKENEFVIRNKLDMSVARVVNPIIYTEDGINYWLIQNPISGSQNAALAIAKKWAEFRINPGPRIKALNDNDIPSHFVYVISSAQTLVAVIDNTNPEDEIFVNIIRYNENTYGALLPM